MYRLISFALAFALAIPALAQSDKPLAFDDVLKLVQLGFSDAEVQAELARTHTTLELTPAQLDALKAAGASEALLAALRPKVAADPVAQVIAAHREGKTAVFLIERILQAKLSPQPVNALTPAIQAGVPHGVLLALRGTPLTAADVTTLATRGASEDELVLLAKGVGLAFALDPKTSLELTRGSVPVAWLVRLRGLGGAPARQDPPTPTDPPVRPDPPPPTDPPTTPVAPAALVQDPGLTDAGLAFLDAIDPAFVHLAKGEHARALAIARAQLDVARELGPWALHSVLTALAWAQLGQGQIDEGLGSLERTIALGSIDFEGIHLIVPAAQLGHPRLKALYAAMRIRRGEHAEYLWHRKAQQQLGHETRMMITENMNRPDSDYTKVPDFPIPDHAVASPDVILGRMYLRRTVLAQRRTVLTSDISRINHLLQMKVIRAMPGATDPDVERRREEEIRRSRVEAEQRCAQRARRYADLAFAPPANGSEAVLAPPLGTVDIAWLREQVLAIAKSVPPEGTGSGEPPATAPAPGSDPNPLAGAKVGDWVQLRITRTLGEERRQEVITSKVVAIAEGSLKEAISNEAGQSAEDTSPIKPTLQEQLLHTFAQQGRVRVLTYKVTPGSFAANGGTLAGRKVELALEVTTAEGTSRVDAVYEIADAVPLLGVLRAELRFANGLVAQVECIGCGRARD